MSYTILAIMICLVMLQTGCGQTDNATTTGSHAVAVATVLDAEPVKRFSTKPGLPVALASPRQGIEVGVVSQVDLSLITPLANTSLEVTITPDTGLTLIAGELTQRLVAANNPDKNNTLPINVQLRADAPGKYYVNLEVTSPEQVNGLNRRALAVIVFAGSEPSRAVKTESHSSPGHHKFPAQETVH